MRRALSTTLAAIALLALPQAAAADDCDVPASGYDRGGSPGSGPANDPLFSRQWGLRQIKAPGAWARGARGKGVTIAVVDSGVDLGHPDLRAKLRRGVDLVKKEEGLSGPGCPGPKDENGHGTHVAGIAAAITNNRIGVAGTAPGASIMPVRVLDRDGAGLADAVNDGIRWAASHGAKVVNVSVGGDVPVVGNVPGVNEDTEAAVRFAFSKGAVVVGSAGNSTMPLCDYPAAAASAVCVASTDPDGNPSFYSNFPLSPNGTVAVRAPGGAGDLLFCESDQDIWSTMWPKSAGDDCGGTIDGYDTAAGTSMAAPFVSGVAALLAGRGLTAPQILQCLKSHSSNGGGYDPIYGYGIVDATAAVSACSPRTPPFQGRQLSVTLLKKSRSQIVEDGRVQVAVRSTTAVKVKLRVAVVRANGTTTGARRTMTFDQAGKRTVTLKLSEKARQALARKGAAKVRVTYTGGGESGVAKTSG